MYLVGICGVRRRGWRRVQVRFCACLRRRVFLGFCFGLRSGTYFSGGGPHVRGGDLWSSEPRMAPCPGAILRVFAPSRLSSVLLWSPFPRSKLAICGFALRGNGRHVASSRQKMPA